LLVSESNAWIDSEKHLFGRPGTPYDFTAQPVDQDITLLAKMRKEQDAMSKKINRKVQRHFFVLIFFPICSLTCVHSRLWH
jgi:hypothetical protein